MLAASTDPWATHATPLTSRSLELFTKLLPTQPNAAFEIAETDDLQARLALHVPRAVITANGALERALDSARRADRAFEELGMPREQARV